jgi:hypothetical protein
MSEDLVHALRRAHRDLVAELADAETQLSFAQQATEGVRARYEAFKSQLPHVCSAAGVGMSAVLENPADLAQPSKSATGPVETSRLRIELALPCRPMSQRWYAGQALHQMGGEGSIAGIADEMRRLGYKHSHEPSRSNQLEQSLAALPSQVPWIVPGDQPGRLRLVVGQ